MTNENKLLERLTKQCCVFFLFMFLGSILVTKICGQGSFKTYDNRNNQDLFGKNNAIEEHEKDDWRSEKEHSTKEIKKKLGKNYIRIKKNQTELFSVDFTEYNMERRLVLDIDNMNRPSILKQDIEMFWDEKKQKKTEDIFKKVLKDVTIQYNTAENGTFKACINFQWNQVYTYMIYEDAEYIYVDCWKPRDIYDQIVVIDAGHGGDDTGSYAKWGEWSEKDYNLDIVNKIAGSWQDGSIKLYFTRTKDEKVSLSDRVEFANELEADLFVSIHCNSTDEYAGSGLEALYKSNSYSSLSQNIAENCLNNLEHNTGLTKRGVLDGQNIYIIRKSKMPTVLLEMGFLSDETDLSYLEQEDGRKKMADTVCVSIKQGLEQIK